MQYEHFNHHRREKYSTHLHILDQLKKKSIENRKIFEPYFNECILTAKRIKNNRQSERDRQICYENFILIQKLERIKKQSGQNVRKNSNNKKFSETTITSYHSPSPFENESQISSSEIDNDQATVADVDSSIEYYDSISTKYKKIYLNNTNMKLSTSSSLKHFSICILPHFDSKSINNHSKMLSNNRQYAFKKEIIKN